MTFARRSTDLILILLLVAVPATSAWATSRDEAETAIAEAEAAHQKALDAGVSDSQAGEMIEEAKSLLPSRQYTKAKKFAYWAVRQSEFALEVQAGDAVVEGDKAAQAEALIAAAEESRKRAASVGGEWRDTAQMIKTAQTLAGAGEFDQAIEAASAAKFQAERGYEQALGEKGADFPDYVRAAAEQ